MRPIKFRYKFMVSSCFDKDDPEYKEDIIYAIYTLKDIEDEKVKDYCYTFDAEVLSRSQFIGFSDEGGREIYEGDKLYFPVQGIDAGFIARVEWHDESGKFIYRDENGWNSFTGKEVVQVIGGD